MALKLSPGAQAIFDEQYAVLEQCGMLPDQELLGAYAIAVAEMRDAQEQLDKVGTVVNSKGRIIQSPYVGIRDRALEAVERLGGRLGLDQSDLQLPEATRAEPRAGRKQISVKRIHEALTNACGVRTHAAQLLGISRRALGRRIEASKALQQAEIDIMTSNNDLAKTKLFQSMRLREAWAVCFWLKTHDPEFTTQNVINMRMKLAGDKDGDPIKVDLSGLSDDELAELNRLLEKGTAPPTGDGEAEPPAVVH